MAHSRLTPALIALTVFIVLSAAGLIAASAKAHTTESAEDVATTIGETNMPTELAYIDNTPELPLGRASSRQWPLPVTAGLATAAGVALLKQRRKSSDDSEGIALEVPSAEEDERDDEETANEEMDNASPVGTTAASDATVTASIYELFRTEVTGPAGSRREPSDTEPSDTEPSDTEPSKPDISDTEPSDTEPAGRERKPVETMVTDFVMPRMIMADPIDPDRAMLRLTMPNLPHPVRMDPEVASAAARSQLRTPASVTITKRVLRTLKTWTSGE